MVNPILSPANISGSAAYSSIASVSAREIDFASGPYGAFKAAIVHYTQGLAYHLAGKKIRANTVSPGNTYFPGGVWEQIQNGNPKLYAEALALNHTVEYECRDAFSPDSYPIDESQFDEIEDAGDDDDDTPEDTKH